MTSSDRHGLIVLLAAIVSALLVFYISTHPSCGRQRGPCETANGIFPDCGRL